MHYDKIKENYKGKGTFMYTWDERVIRKLKKFSKKNKFTKKLAMLLIYLICFISALLKWFSDHQKKIYSLVSLSIFFLVSCSFALPGFIETSEIDEYKIVAQAEEVHAEEQQIEEILSGNESLYIDDEEVTYGPDDEEITNVQLDYYSADDILTAANIGSEEDDVASGEIDESENEEGTTNTEDLIEDYVSISDMDPLDWRYILVNKQHPVPENYEFTLGTIQGSMECDERILDDLYAMLLAAKNDRVSLLICSPYRDYNRQEVLFERKVKAYKARGLSYAEAYSAASMYVTAPGASEHQIGLAFDIVSVSHQTLDYEFGSTQSGIWLQENSYKYGFILRYPYGAGDITGIVYEPWHFRYVGVEAATYIKQHGITLEEFVDELNANQ